MYNVYRVTIMYARPLVPEGRLKCVVSETEKQLVGLASWGRRLVKRPSVPIKPIHYPSVIQTGT